MFLKFIIFFLLYSTRTEGFELPNTIDPANRAIIDDIMKKMTNLLDNESIDRLDTVLNQLFKLLDDPSIAALKKPKEKFAASKRKKEKRAALEKREAKGQCICFPVKEEVVTCDKGQWANRKCCKDAEDDGDRRFSPFFIPPWFPPLLPVYPPTPCPTPSPAPTAPTTPFWGPPAVYTTQTTTRRGRPPIRGRDFGLITDISADLLTNPPLPPFPDLGRYEYRE